jgi:CubicO group peptidase (beta-lactamase class C family)
MTASFTGVARGAIGGDVVFDLAEGDVHAGTRFQLASVSKAFTAAAALLLVEQARFQLDTRIERWFAPQPDAWAPITIHHLLTHSAGLPHWEELPEIDLTEPMEAAAEVAAFMRPPLRFEPGAGWCYSSPGYVLLALIVERESGHPYAEFLRQSIFDPLEMAATFAGNGEGESDLAPPLADGRPTKSFDLDRTGMGAGDVWSTAGDMLRWHRALLQGRFLSPELRRAMLGQQVPTPADADMSWPEIQLEGYGYGWFTGRIEGEFGYFHSGGNAGFRTFTAAVPGRDLSAIVLCNDENVGVRPTFANVLAASR